MIPRCKSLLGRYLFLIFGLILILLNSDVGSFINHVFHLIGLISIFLYGYFNGVEHYAKYIEDGGEASTEDNNENNP